MTPNQEEQVAKLRREGMTVSDIARRMSVSRSAVGRVTAKLSASGVSPGMTPAKQIDGMRVVKTTVQTNANGEIINEWRRWMPDADDVEAWIESLESRVSGAAVKINKPTAQNSALMLELPIPDHHMGMLSWCKETGQDYDCHVATTLLVDGVKAILADTPKVGKIAMVVMGDYYHSDNRSGVTERGGNILDTDSRYTKRLDAGIDALCRCVELAATRAEEVQLVVISGNHDWHSAKWLARVMAAYYNKSQHVKVCLDPRPRQYITWGKVMLGYMHGDTMKAQQFARVIPQEMSKLWSDTEYRYGRVGHWHHRSTEEYPGVVIETLPTLAAPDAWANEHGYMSRRAITAYLWHKDHGLRSKMERGVAEILGKA
jgi:hypothetical protein